MDSIEMHRTAMLVLFNILLAISVYLLYYPAKKCPYTVSQISHKVGTVLILIFIIFSFWGNDWFHLFNFFPAIQAGEQTHIEEVYIWIAQNISSNYLVFRLIIWGSGLFLLYMTLKRLPISLYLQLYMFVVFGLIWFSYARVSLAMAMMFYGSTILCKPYKNRTISYILGLGCIVLSYYFHKSAIFGISIIGLSFIFKLFNRWTLMLIVILVPLLFILIKNLLTDFITIDVETESELERSIFSAQSYLAKDEIRSGIGSILLKLAERIPYVAIAYMCLKIYLSPTFSNIPIEIGMFMRIMFFIVAISIIFLFDLGFSTNVIAERFFRFSFIPAFILMAYFWQNNMFKRLTKWTLRLGIFGTSYALLYSLYMDLL